MKTNSKKEIKKTKNRNVKKTETVKKSKNENKIK